MCGWHKLSGDFTLINFPIGYPSIFEAIVNSTLRSTVSRITEKKNEKKISTIFRKYTVWIYVTITGNIWKDILLTYFSGVVEII